VEIQSSKKFLSDITRYNNMLDKIESAEVKDRLFLLIKKLKFEVKKLDFQHQDYIVNKSLLLNINEVRANINSVRNEIEQIIKFIN